MRRSTRLHATLGALLASGLGGCGPAPYTIGPEEPVSVDATPAHLARVARAPAAEAEDRWFPDGLPRFNPFVDKRTWVGEYECPQGRTGLTLRVVDVRGPKVRAIFDFHHAPTDTSGQFLMAGTFDEQTGDVQLAPGPWIIHPTDYEAVGMTGRVSVDGKRFVGRIASAGCGAFRLRSVQ